MSIEKIKERIRMIEENDFRTSGDTVSNLISEITTHLEPNDVDYLTGQAVEPQNFFQRKGFQPTQAQKSLSMVGSASSQYDQAQAMANQALSGSNRVQLSGELIPLPLDKADSVMAIYALLGTHKIELKDVNSHGDPYYGYQPTNSPGTNDINSLWLMKNKQVRLDYNDSDFSHLVVMVIEMKRWKSGELIKFRDFVNELNRVGWNDPYNISNAEIIGSEIVIKFP